MAVRPPKPFTAKRDWSQDPAWCRAKAADYDREHEASSFARNQARAYECAAIANELRARADLLEKTERLPRAAHAAQLVVSETASGRGNAAGG